MSSKFPNSSRGAYGSMDPYIPPEVLVVGGQRNAGFSETEFRAICEAVSSNIFTVQSNGSNLERGVKILGTERDSQGFRDSLHITQLSTNQIITQTSLDIRKLTNLARQAERPLRLQTERLRSEFQESLQRYSYLQKEVAQRMKSSLPLPYQVPKHSSEESDRHQLLESEAEERHQQLQLLQEAEFDTAMLLEREQRVRLIENDILDVNQIMKELATMVHEQGDTINSIENNIESTHGTVEQGRQQLEKAANYQKTHRKCLCFFVGVGFTVAIVIGIILYFTLEKS